MTADIKLTTSTSSTVSFRSVARAMNGVGGPVWIWREASMNLALLNAVLLAPVNNPLNATHRGGVVGTYKRSFSTSRRGSNQYQMRFSLSNSADHAAVVEDGRRASNRQQTFAWTKNNPPGSIRTHEYTGSRAGRKVIITAVRSALAATT